MSWWSTPAPRTMAPSIIVIGAIFAASIWVVISYRDRSDAPFFKHAIALALFSGLLTVGLLTAALISTSPTIWWGYGCPRVNHRAGLC